MNPKSFDNFIARLGQSDIPRGRQGVERRIPVTLLPQLLLCAELAARFSMPFRQAFQLSKALANGQQPAAPFVRLEVDFNLLHVEIDRQLESAVESVVRRPRGRPRASDR